MAGARVRTPDRGGLAGTAERPGGQRLSVVDDLITLHANGVVMTGQLDLAALVQLHREMVAGLLA